MQRHNFAIVRNKDFHAQGYDCSHKSKLLNKLQEGAGVIIWHQTCRCSGNVTYFGKRNRAGNAQERIMYFSCSVRDNLEFSELQWRLQVRMHHCERLQMFLASIRLQQNSDMWMTGKHTLAIDVDVESVILFLARTFFAQHHQQPHSWWTGRRCRALLRERSLLTASNTLIMCSYRWVPLYPNMDNPNS